MDENNNNSLEPIVLGELKAQKSSKPIFVLITFIILGGILFSLPLITGVLLDDNNPIGRLYQSIFLPSEVEDRVIITPDTLHSLGSNTSIAFETITLTKVEFEDNMVRYTLTNRTGDLNLDNDTLYFEIYSSRQAFLNRVPLTGMINNQGREFSYEFTNLKFHDNVDYIGRIQRKDK